MSSAQAKKEKEMAQRRAAEKKAAEFAKQEAHALLSSVVQQKVPFGVDPKSVLCVLFRDGKCPRGAKCKFSHDMDVGKRATKKDLYTDGRDKKENDTMENWDEEKLRSVILSKHGNVKTTTDIVCKFFVDAVENEKYGWFWVCPNAGTECKYRHSLPEGFVLKTKEQKRLEKIAIESQPKITLEEFIETERHKLPKTGLTPVTLETFSKWKADNQIKKLNEKKNEKVRLTGREIFEQKFLDKSSAYEEDESDAFDMTAFQKALDPEDENIKDYGDGSHVSFKSPSEKKDAAAPLSEIKEEKNEMNDAGEAEAETKTQIETETETIKEAESEATESNQNSVIEASA